MDTNSDQPIKVEVVNHEPMSDHVTKMVVGAVAVIVVSRLAENAIDRGLAWSKRRKANKNQK